MNEGLLFFSIWHEYPMDDPPDGFGLFNNFTRHMDQYNDVESVVPADLSLRFRAWAKMNFNVRSFLLESKPPLLFALTGACR